MTTDEHRDDLRIAQALSALGSLDLGPEPVLEAPSTGRARSRNQTHRPGLFAGFAVAGALAVAIVAVVLHTPGQKPTVAKGTPDRQLAAAILGSWDVAEADGSSTNDGRNVNFFEDGTFRVDDGCTESTAHWVIQNGRLALSRVRSRTDPLKGQPPANCVAGVPTLGMTSGQLDGQPVAIDNGQLVIGSGANAHRYVPPPDLGPGTERFVGLWEPVLADGRPALPHNARLALRPDGTFAATDFCQTIRGDWLVDQRSLFSSGGAKGAYETCPPGATSLPVAAREVVARATRNSMVLGDQRFLRVPMPVVPEQRWLPGYDHLTADTAVTDMAILTRVIAGMKGDPSNGYTNQPVYAWHLADAEGQGGQQAHYYLAGFDGHSCIATLYEANAAGGGYRDGTGCTAIDTAPDPAAPTGVDDVFIVPDAVQSITAQNATGAPQVVDAKNNAVVLPRGYVPATITYTLADGTLTTVNAGGRPECSFC